MTEHGTKQCTACGHIKPHAEFYPDRRSRDGRRGHCMSCGKENARDWRGANLERASRNWMRCKLENPRRYMLWRAKQHAAAAGRECSITEADIDLPAVCPVLGITLNYTNAPRNAPDAASLDRVDNALGYVPGNVVTVSSRANSLKRDASLDEMRRVLEFYEAKEKQHGRQPS